MRVRLATQVIQCYCLLLITFYKNISLHLYLDLFQIFSNSVTAGLKFYSSQKHENLNGYEATADFCTWMNDMFDALNRKMPNQGVTPDSNDYQVYTLH